MIKNIFLLLIICLFFVFGCSTRLPSVQYVDQMMRSRLNWNIGNDNNFMVTKKLYFYPESYVSTKGKVSHCILYCETSRGDTIAVVDTNYRKIDVVVANIKIQLFTKDAKDLNNAFNISFDQSWDFIKVFKAIDSLYVGDFN